MDGRADEMVVEELHTVGTALQEVLHQLHRKSGGRLVVRLGGELRVVLRRRIAFPAHRLGHLATDRENRDFFHALRTEGSDTRAYLPDNIGIEAAAERRVGGQTHQRHMAERTLGGITSVRTDVFQEFVQGALQGLLIGQHALNRRLRLVKLGRSDHLHRRSDLERTLDGLDASLDFLERSHDLPT